MSSIAIRKPEYRLLLGYPDAILTRVGVEEPVGSASPGSESFGADLRRLGAEVLRAGGRLTVVLPASEVWRGQVEPGGWAPRAEWRAARDRAALALGVAPEALRTVVGRRSAVGVVPAVAVRRSTLAEVRGLLASVGLKPAAIVGAGAFEGFATPPRLCGRWTPPPVGRRRALAGAGGLAAAAVALLLIGLRPGGGTLAPAATPVSPAAVVAAAPPAALAAAAMTAAQASAAAASAEPAPLRVARADPPPRRPAAPFVPAGAASRPLAAVGTRSVPMVIVTDNGGAVAEIRLAELTDARSPLTDAAVPLPRPATEPAPVVATPLGPVPSLRPAPRPGVDPGGATAREAAAPAPAGYRPMARPASEAVRVASLGDQVSDAVIAAAVLAPIARPEGVRTVAPRPVLPVAAPAAAAAAKPAVPAPKPAAKPVTPPVVRSVALAPKPVAPPVVRSVALAPKPAAATVVRAAPKPAVQRVVRVETAPARAVAQPVRAARAPAPARVAAAPARQTESVRRTNTRAGGFASRFSRKDDLALVGIVGGSDGRHALLQMPNGRIQKVAAGDRVQGVEIAAIGSDSVRVSDGRRESVLAMPD